MLWPWWVQSVFSHGGHVEFDQKEVHGISSSFLLGWPGGPTKALDEFVTPSPSSAVTLWWCVMASCNASVVCRKNVETEPRLRCIHGARVVAKKGLSPGQACRRLHHQPTHVLRGMSRNGAEDTFQYCTQPPPGDKQTNSTLHVLDFNSTQ